jgi:hypothetical protein
MAVAAAATAWASAHEACSSARPVFGRDAQGVPNAVGVFVPPETIFPGTPETAEALIEVLATLSRDDTLFH